MDIERILEQCRQLPGISLHRTARGAELRLRSPGGEGSMHFLGLFPGVTLAYIRIQAESWPAPDLGREAPAGKGPLLVNYCVSGRCELMLHNGSYVYLADRQLSLTEQFARQQYRYPRRSYQGLELFLDLEGAAARSGFLAEELGLRLDCLARRCCPDGATYIAAAPPEAERLLRALWELGPRQDDRALARQRLATLSLLGLLQYEPLPPSQSCTFYTETQVEIARRTEAILTADLRQHHPARELAVRFAVSETSLKNYFRGVFGQNFSVYLREVRMRRAAQLLASSQLPVSAVAEAVGYANQSKFAAVFRQAYRLSPLEYRRASRLGPEKT